MFRTCKGLFEPSHIPFELDRVDEPYSNPSIVDMTEKAIQILSKNEKGFFLVVEGTHDLTNESIKIGFFYLGPSPSK